MVNVRLFYILLLGIVLSLPIVNADAGIAMLFFLGVFLPALIIVSFIISCIWNIFVVFIIFKLDKRKIKISEWSWVWLFIKYTIIVGILEILLIFPVILIPLSRSFLVFTGIYSILSGVIIFLIFKWLVSKQIKLNIKTINKYSLLMAIFTNPIFLLLLLYSFKLTV